MKALLDGGDFFKPDYRLKPRDRFEDWEAYRKRIKPLCPMERIAITPSDEPTNRRHRR